MPEGPAAHGIAIGQRYGAGAGEELLLEGAEGVDGTRRPGQQLADVEGVAAQPDQLERPLAGVVPVDDQVDDQHRLGGEPLHGGDGEGLNSVVVDPAAPAPDALQADPASASSRGAASITFRSQKRATEAEASSARSATARLRSGWRRRRRLGRSGLAVAARTRRGVRSGQGRSSGRRDDGRWRRRSVAHWSGGTESGTSSPPESLATSEPVASSSRSCGSGGASDSGGSVKSYTGS